MLLMSRTEAIISHVVCLMLLTIVSEALYSYHIQICADYNSASCFRCQERRQLYLKWFVNASDHSVRGIIFVPFKNIWPKFIIVYPIGSFQDHMTLFYHCVPNWLLLRPYDLTYALCTQLTPFKTIDSFQDHLITSNRVIWSWKESIGYTMLRLGQMVLKGVNWVHNAKVRSYGLERSQLGTQW